jgi:hypothetical protein
MKQHARIALVLTSCSVLTVPVLAQGTFQDLDFEDASLSPVPFGGGLVPITEALPGWTGYLGGAPVTQVLQNNLTLGQASIDIIGPGWTTGTILQGNKYTLVLQPGFRAGLPVGPPQISASVSQYGLVPATANSIQLEEWGYVGFAVSLGGQNLALVPIGVGPDYTLYGANISQLAGQGATLTITALPTGVAATPDYFDAIAFSPQVIPEPNSVALLALCVLILTAGLHLLNPAFKIAPSGQPER